MSVFALIILVVGAMANGFVAAFATSTVAMCLHGLACALCFIAAGIKASLIPRGGF